MALVLTKKGLELLQKLQVGEIPAIEFSDVAVGDGLWASSDINLDIAALKSVRIKTGIGSKKTTTRGEDTIVTISATLNNENITESFYVREVGLYAKDGESEILYAYDIIPENETAQAVVQSNIVPQYIPIMLDTALSNIDKVNITVTDDINFVITSEFEEYKEDTAETINNLKSELQGKIDEANELIASLNTAIDTAKSEITTAYKQADTTMQTTITKAYKAADTALQTAINGKAATNHNHDRTYSKTNHTHTGYAASNHNHDSTYLKKTDASSTYASKYHDHQQIIREEIFSRFDIFSPVTTQQLVTKIIGLTAFSKMFSEWIDKSKPVHITDLPEDIMYLDITVIDKNGLFLEARAPFGNNSLWVGSVNNGVFGGWQKRH